jgi:ABC-type sugar transport system ATPase subunit
MLKETETTGAAVPPPGDGGATSYALVDLTRRFPGVTAVDGANLAVRRGELHGVIGRNGAGKSVLVSMIAGLLRPTSGTVVIGDSKVDATHYTPARARELGVALVPQEPRFATALSVADNLFMGRTRADRLGFARGAVMHAEAARIMESLAIPAKPTDRMGDLPLESQQLLAFGRAVFVDAARVVLLDEITASLSQPRKLELLRLLRGLLAERPDLSFTLISHHIAEIMEFCDRVTVMRDGVAVATIDVAATSERELARWIVGDAAGRRTARAGVAARGPAAPVLSVAGLAVERAFAGLDVELRAGEVVGFAGLEGSGKDEAVKALFGLARPSAGEIRLDGRRVRFATPRDALAAGLAYLPRHREEHGIVRNLSVEVNTLLAAYGRFRRPLGFLRRRAAREAARTRTRHLAVKTPSIDTPIDNLSGGNKQKVLTNRLALADPRVFLLNEPTRGVDIASKPALLAVVRDELAAAGAVLMLSESEEELVETCDRIHVFFKGRVREVLERGTPGFTVGRLYALIQGVERP